MVTLTLAHPLSAAQVEKLHAQDSSRDYVQGDKITLPRDDARLVINAGYCDGVDPEDHEAVRKALDSTAKTATKTAKPSS
jgi:hypothetical protein